MKNNFSLTEVLEEASTLSNLESKIIYVDVNTINKLKSVCVDFPDYNISHTKLANAILKQWLEENRDNLMDNLMSKIRGRY